MKSNTITADVFSLTADDSRTAVTGTVTYDADGLKLVFTPSSGLADDTLYTASVAVDVADENGFTMEEEKTWSFRTAPSSTEPVAQPFTIPAGTGTAYYRIASLPVQPDVPTPRSVFGSVVGSYDPVQMRLGTWVNSTRRYMEYPFTGLSTDALGPGFAFWALFREGADFNFNGTRAATTHSPYGPGYYFPINPGWNMVGNPYLYTISVDNLVVEDDNGSHEQLNSSANSITQNVFWTYRNGSYSPARILLAAQGGWVKKLTAGSGYVFFPAVQALSDAAPRNVEAPADMERPPAPPAELAETGSGGGGGGGCFLDRVAYE